MPKLDKTSKQNIEKNTKNTQCKKKIDEKNQNDQVCARNKLNRSLKFSKFLSYTNTFVGLSVMIFSAVIMYNYYYILHDNQHSFEEITVCANSFNLYIRKVIFLPLGSRKGNIFQN